MWLSLHKTGFCLRELPDMFQQVHALWRRLSPRLHCSDDYVSVTLVVDFANLILQDDILLPRCPVATEELLCLRVDKIVHTQVTHPLGCCRNHVGRS